MSHLAGGDSLGCTGFQPSLLWWPLRLQVLLLPRVLSFAVTALLLLSQKRLSLSPAVVLHLGFGEWRLSLVVVRSPGLGIRLGAPTPPWGQQLLGLTWVGILPRGLADLGLVCVFPWCLRGTAQVLLCWLCLWALIGVWTRL